VPTAGEYEGIARQLSVPEFPAPQRSGAWWRRVWRFSGTTSLRSLRLPPPSGFEPDVPVLVCGLNRLSDVDLDLEILTPDPVLSSAFEIAYVSQVACALLLINPGTNLRLNGIEDHPYMRMYSPPAGFADTVEVLPG